MTIKQAIGLFDFLYISSFAILLVKDPRPTIFPLASFFIEYDSQRMFP